MKTTQEYPLTITPGISYALYKASKYLLIGGLFVIAAFFFPFAIFGFIFFLACFWLSFLYTRNIRYTVDIQTIKVRTGLFSYTTNTLELYRVKDYTILEPFFMRIFGLMTLKMYTVDASQKQIAFAGIKQSNIADKIRELVQKARNSSKIIELN